MQKASKSMKTFGKFRKQDLHNYLTCVDQTFDTFSFIFFPIKGYWKENHKNF